MDEGIVLQATEVERYGIKELSLDEMVLTNKNIICVYEKSTGLFSKPEQIVEKIPLSTIKVANGQAQVMVHDSDDYGKGLQVLFISGHREHFIFSDSPKKTMPVWINEINRILVGAPVQPVMAETAPEAKTKKSFLGGIAGALGGLDIQSVVDKAQEKIGNLANQIQNVGTNQTPSQPAHTYTAPEVKEQPVVSTSTQQDEQPVVPPTPPAEQNTETKMLFCSNCGTKLNEGSKFCHGCGAAVGTVVPQPQVQTPPPVQQEPNRSERQQEYVGKVLKCPHCGGVITETTAICPSCGMQITGRAAVSSIQEFKNQLMEIENSRKHGYGKMFSFTVDPADMKKLSLIRNFPIPNSVDDIVEFMLLAVANIEVSLSKQTAMNRFNNWGKSEETSATIATTISDAWVAKMEQVYKKAEIVFPNEPAFAGIQKMYFDKMKELKIKVN